MKKLLIALSLMSVLSCSNILEPEIEEIPQNEVEIVEVKDSIIKDIETEKDSIPKEIVEIVDEKDSIIKDIETEKDSTHEEIEKTIDIDSVIVEEIIEEPLDTQKTIKEEIKEEIKDSIVDDIKEEIKDSIIKDIKDEIKEEIKDSIISIIEPIKDTVIDIIEDEIVSANTSIVNYLDGLVTIDTITNKGDSLHCEFKSDSLVYCVNDNPYEEVVIKQYFKDVDDTTVHINVGVGGLADGQIKLAGYTEYIEVRDNKIGNYAPLRKRKFKEFEISFYVRKGADSYSANSKINIQMFKQNYSDEIHDINYSTKNKTASEFNDEEKKLMDLLYKRLYK